MSQQLIVEGKDAIVIANLLSKRGLKPPLGYETKQKFSNDFVKQAGSISQVNFTLGNALKQPDITNIGVIVDANNVGAAKRLTGLLEVINTTLDQTFSDQPQLTSRGFTAQLLPNLKIGIWIMPNNKENGYLEHFLLELIGEENELLLFAREKVEELIVKGLVEFSEVKKEKAILHTYLALQKNPGLPMETAIEANYINALSDKVADFEEWFKSIFVLAK